MFDINQYSEFKAVFNNVLPGMPFTTQDMSYLKPGDSLDSVKRIEIAKQEIECIFSFGKIAALAAQIRFKSLPEGVSAEDAAQDICKWRGWSAVDQSQMSVELFTEYGDSIWGPIYQVRNTFHEKQPLIESFAQKITSIYNDDPKVTTSHDFQRWRYHEQLDNHLVKSQAVVSQGCREIEDRLSRFITEVGAPEKQKFISAMEIFLKAGESLKDGIHRLYHLSFVEKQSIGFFNKFEPCRTILGGTTGGFLLALQQAIKAGAVSRDFLEENAEFINWCVEHCEAMDRANFNSRFGNDQSGWYDDVLTSRPSSYMFLKH